MLKLAAIYFFAIASGVVAQQQPMLDGPCAYDKYPGKATITKIEKNDKIKGPRGLVPYVGYEISYTFTPDKPIHGLAAQFAKRTWLFLLLDGANEIYPGDKYIAKYDIKVGKVYSSRMSVIKKGTCTPVLFKLQGLDESDTFEKDK